MAEEIPEDVQRWTSKRRAALVLSILKGETSVQEAARKNGLTVAEIEDWRERFPLAAENALRSRPKDEEALKDERIKKLERKIGEMWSSTWTSCWRECGPTSLWTTRHQTSPERDRRCLPAKGLSGASGLTSSRVAAFVRLLRAQDTNER